MKSRHFSLRFICHNRPSVTLYCSGGKLTVPLLQKERTINKSINHLYLNYYIYQYLP